MKHRCLAIVALCLFLFAGPLGADQDQDETRRQETYASLELFANVLTLLQQYYVEPIEATQVIKGAIDGMLSSLDPHSAYLDPEDFQELQEETQGSFVGIGVEITIRHDVLTVVAPIEDTPAARAGIRSGDRILRIDGHPTKDMTLFQAVKLLRGERGTSVRITVGRSDWDQPREIELVRDLIPLHSVKSRLLRDRFGYLRITTFQANTIREFRQHLRRLEKQAPLAGLVLDLRNNPGGLLDQAVQVSDVFLEEGVIVSTRGRDPEQNMVYSAHRSGTSPDYPVIVLVNAGTASGAEIVAGALQDHRRALILGTETFGKGSVQTVIPMDNGAGIRLTTARYYTPNGRSIQAKGVTPDIYLPWRAPAADATAEEDWTVREKDLPHHLASERATEDAAAGDRDAAEDEATRKLLAGDNQLRMALLLLEGLDLMRPRPRQETDRPAEAAGDGRESASP